MNWFWKSNKQHDEFVDETGFENLIKDKMSLWMKSEHVWKEVKNLGCWPHHKSWNLDKIAWQWQKEKLAFF